MLMTDLQHQLMKDLSLLEVAFVTLHVSERYRRTDFTYWCWLKIHSSVFLDITFELHTGIRIENAVLAFAILCTCMSRSDPPSLLMLLPRYAISPPLHELLPPSSSILPALTSVDPCHLCFGFVNPKARLC